ncbi:hypothetical protein BDZ94DRAFT_1307889 [Collybia nuda]|uniref:Uncharacterized protein n=1 Tax=Collybia nuda TaxID=64659 RepID=A0A9P5Y6R4_9AGAR|nr:hypothetical protein BDZ94DRAFT_1307889 [Collybia nuda]
MASPFRQELQSIQDEVTEIAVIVSRVQQRLTDVTRRSEEHGDVWKARVIELEIQNKEYFNKANWLHQQNAHLESRVAQWKPEMDNAINARNAAFRKLKNTRRVVRDLIDERGDDPRGGTSSVSDAIEIKDEEITRALRDPLTNSRDSMDTDSDKTVRGGRPSLPIAKSSPTTSLRSARYGGRASARSSLRSDQGGNTTHSDALSESFVATPTQSSDLSVHPVAESLADRQEWRVHYSKPPASASISTGPVSHSKLVRCAIIKEETVGDLKSLDLDPEFGLRLHIEGDRVFVYDPIFLEGPSQTYILEWSRVQVNQKTREYITRGGAKMPVFHTFTFPTTENSHKWYYIGMHSWVATELPWSVWESLGQKSRQKLLKKLSERCHMQVDEQDIVKMLDSGELSQFCMEISSTLYQVKSEKFARRIGYGPRPDTRPERVDSGSGTQ